MEVTTLLCHIKHYSRRSEMNNRDHPFVRIVRHVRKHRRSSEIFSYLCLVDVDKREAGGSRTRSEGVNKKFPGGAISTAVKGVLTGTRAARRLHRNV
jgi:hypothetical protein